MLKIYFLNMQKKIRIVIFQHYNNLHHFSIKRNGLTLLQEHQPTLGFIRTDFISRNIVKVA